MQVTFTVGDKVRLSPLMLSLGWPATGVIEDIDETRSCGISVRLEDSSLVRLHENQLLEVIARESFIFSRSWLAASDLITRSYAAERHGFSSHMTMDTFATRACGCLDADMPDVAVKEKRKCSASKSRRS